MKKNKKSRYQAKQKEKNNRRRAERRERMYNELLPKVLTRDVTKGMVNEMFKVYKIGPVYKEKIWKARRRFFSNELKREAREKEKEEQMKFREMRQKQKKSRGIHKKYK